MVQKKTRLLIADDHPVVRQGLAAIFAVQPDIDVVGEAADGVEAVAMAGQLRPDVLLLDLKMPRLDGLGAIREIARAALGVRILVLTGFANDERVFPAIKAGALGYLLKDTPRDQLLQAVRDVAEGRAFLHPAIALKLMREINQPPGLHATTDPLTEREMGTLRLIARGLTNQEISRELSVHETTIAKYVSSILDKLHLANRTQAALYALRHRIVDLDEALDEGQQDTAGRHP